MPAPLYQHPIYSTRFRRWLYVSVSIILAVAHWGSINILGTDRVAPTLFALASATTLVGSVKIESMTMWAVSGWATFAAFAFRLSQIWAIELGWSDQEPPDSSAIASAAYLFCCVATPAVWRHWLRPQAARDA